MTIYSCQYCNSDMISDFKGGVIPVQEITCLECGGIQTKITNKRILLKKVKKRLDKGRIKGYL